jgi:hypothetical protein
MKNSLILDRVCQLSLKRLAMVINGNDRIGITTASRSHLLNDGFLEADVREEVVTAS